MRRSVIQSAPIDMAIHVAQSHVSNLSALIRPVKCSRKPFISSRKFQCHQTPHKRLAISMMAGSAPLGIGKSCPPRNGEPNKTYAMPQGVLAASIAFLVLQRLLASSALAVLFPQFACLCASALIPRPCHLCKWRLHSSSAPAKGQCISTSRRA